MTDPTTFTVSDEESGKRLDRVVADRFPDLGRKRARELCDGGAVTVDGRRGRKGDGARSGAIVAVVLPPPRAATADPAAPLAELLVTDDVVIVDKPAGQASAPLTADEGGSAAEALLARYPEMARVGYSPLEPGLLHRLDTQTSGVLVAARSGAAWERLRDALVAGRLTKRYLALVERGRLPPSGSIEAPIGPDPRGSRRVVVTDEGRPASTTYRVVGEQDERALVELTVARAYRHQIRVHLAHMGAPLLGDELYGGRRTRGLGGRHALHASYAACVGEFEAAAPLPPDLAALCPSSDAVAGR